MVGRMDSRPGWFWGKGKPVQGHAGHQVARIWVRLVIFDFRYSVDDAVGFERVW